MTRRRLPLLALAVASAVLFSSSASVAWASEDEARKHFKAGVSYLQDPEGERFEEAYAEFKKAYELAGSAKVLGNLGLCAMKLERDGEAIAAYTRYLAEVSDIDPDERKQVQSDLETLQASVVRVEVAVQLRGKASLSSIAIHDARLPARGASILNVYPAEATLKLAIRPGRHLMTVHVDGRPGPAWEFQAVPGTRMAHTFVVGDAERSSPAPAPAREEAPSRALPIVVLGVGAAALAAGGVVGVAALGKQRDLDDKCPNYTCPAATYQNDVDSVRDYVRAADYLFLGGGALAAVGIIWLIAASPGEPQPPARAASRVSSRVGCAPAGCAASLRVGF